MTRSADVRLLHPIRIVLSTDDSAFADRLRTAAGERRFELACVPASEDPELALVRHAADVFVLDADIAPARGARAALAFAALHPEIPVVVVVEKPTTATVAGLPLLDKWRSAERLVGEIERAYLGLRR